MTNYTYSRVVAFNPNTSPVSVAKSATGSVYAIADTTFTTPLNITLVVGGAVVTSISTDPNGVFPDFTLLDRTSCVWKQSGVSFATVLTTTDPVPGPTGTPGSAGATGAKGDRGDLATWQTATFYPLNQVIANPSGDLVKVITAHTSGGAYDATKFDYVVAPTTTAALAGKVAKGELVINARDYGVVGNGTTDDRAALLAAANAAVTLGYPLAIPGTFTCALAAPLILPAGLRLNTNGAKFAALAQTGRQSQIQLASNTTVTGGIYITTLGGINGSGLTIQGATNVRIDVVDVASTVSGQGSANVRDNGLNINGSSYIVIDRVRVKNFDFPVGIETVPNLTINWVDAETYVKAVWLRDTPHLRLNGGWIRGASPNTAYLPGHNGVLLEATVLAEDIRINNVAVYDAGEHGFRTSGPAQIKNIWFNNCSAINCTGTGFKILGSLLAEGVYNENVFLLNCLAEDCGLVNQNTCGFLIQMAKYVKVVSPIVRNRDKTSSGYSGIRLGGVTHVQITDPDLKNVSQYGIYLDSELSNVSDVKINGANIDQDTGWCIYLSNGFTSPAVANTFNNIEIEASCSLTNTAGGAFYAGKGAYTTEGAWAGFNRIQLRTHDNIATTIATSTSTTALASFWAEITGKKNGTMVFRNGSLWIDTTTGNRQIAKAGAWVTL